MKTKRITWEYLETEEGTPYNKGSFKVNFYGNKELKQVIGKVEIICDNKDIDLIEATILYMADCIKIQKELEKDKEEKIYLKLRGGIS